MIIKYRRDNVSRRGLRVLSIKAKTGRVRSPCPVMLQVFLWGVVVSTLKTRHPLQLPLLSLNSGDTRESSTICFFLRRIWDKDDSNVFLKIIFKEHFSKYLFGHHIPFYLIVANRAMTGNDKGQRYTTVVPSWTQTGDIVVLCWCLNPNHWGTQTRAYLSIKLRKTAASKT